MLHVSKRLFDIIDSSFFSDDDVSDIVRLDDLELTGMQAPDPGESDGPLTQWAYEEYAWEAFTMQARPTGEGSSGRGQSPAPGQDAMGPTGTIKKLRRSTRRPTCQVDGCAKDLSEDKSYLQRYSVCERHFKANEVQLNGRVVRFCQQCNKFQPAVEFEGTRRSCAARSKDRNMRRRLQNAKSKATSSNDNNTASTAHPRTSDDSGNKRSPGSESCHPSGSGDSHGDDNDTRSRLAPGAWAAGHGGMPGAGPRLSRPGMFADGLPQLMGGLGPLGPLTGAGAGGLAGRGAGAAYARSSFGSGDGSGRGLSPADELTLQQAVGMHGGAGYGPGSSRLQQAGAGGGLGDLLGLGALHGMNRSELRAMSAAGLAGSLAGAARSDLSAAYADFAAGPSVLGAMGSFSGLNPTQGAGFGRGASFVGGHHDERMMLEDLRFMGGSVTQSVGPNTVHAGMGFDGDRGSGNGSRISGAAVAGGGLGGASYTMQAAAHAQAQAHQQHHHHHAMQQQQHMLQEEMSLGLSGLGLSGHGLGGPASPGGATAMQQRMRQTASLPSTNVLAAQLSNMDQEFMLSRVCLKLLSCTPADLPDDMLARLRLWMNNADSELVQAFIRPGCTHLVANLFGDANANDVAKFLFADGNAAAAAQRLQEALGPLLAGRGVTVQAGDSAMVVLDGRPVRYVASVKEQRHVPDITRTSVAALRAGCEGIVTVEGRNLTQPDVRFFARHQGTDYPLLAIPELSRSGSLALRVPALPSPGLVVIEAGCMELMGDWVALVAVEDEEEVQELNAWAQAAEPRNKNWLLTGLGQLLDYTSMVPSILARLGAEGEAAAAEHRTPRSEDGTAAASVLTPAELAQLVASGPDALRRPGVYTAPCTGESEGVAAPDIGAAALSFVMPAAHVSTEGARAHEREHEDEDDDGEHVLDVANKTPRMSHAAVPTTGSDLSVCAPPEHTEQHTPAATSSCAAPGCGEAADSIDSTALESLRLGLPQGVTLPPVLVARNRALADDYHATDSSGDHTRSWSSTPMGCESPRTHADSPMSGMMGEEGGLVARAACRVLQQGGRAGGHVAACGSDAPSHRSSAGGSSVGGGGGGCGSHRCCSMSGGGGAPLTSIPQALQTRLMPAADSSSSHSRLRQATSASAAAAGMAPGAAAGSGNSTSLRTRLALAHPLLQPACVSALLRKAHKLLVYTTSSGLPSIATRILEFILGSGYSFSAAMSGASSVLLDLQEAYYNSEDPSQANTAACAPLQGSYSLLHTAVESGFALMVEQVLDWGEQEGRPWDVALPGPACVTPLHCAAALPSGCIAKLLLARGRRAAHEAWFSARNADGDTPADVAAASGKAWLNDAAEAIASGQQQLQHAGPAPYERSPLGLVSSSSAGGALGGGAGGSVASAADAMASRISSSGLQGSVVVMPAWAVLAAVLVLVLSLGLLKLA